MAESLIILRAPEPEDLELLYLWENDPEIWQVSNTITPFSKYILRQYIENSHLDIYQTRQLRLMIDVRENESTLKTIGTIDLFDFDPYHHRAGVGVLIGDKTNRNKGYATTALKQLIDYCFGTLQLHQLYCNITMGNDDSLRLFEKCGFSITGHKTDWIRQGSIYAEELLLQLINRR